MKIKQKFFILAGVVGAVMIVISAIGYNTADNALELATQEEMLAYISSKSSDSEAWLSAKAQYAKAIASTLSKIPDTAQARRPELLSGILADQEFQDIYNVMDDGYAWALISGDLNGKREWRERPWYLEVKKAGRFLYTDPYEDAETKKLVVSATIPYSRSGGPGGALSLDIKMDSLQARVNDIKFRGEGTGYILNPATDLVAVSADESQSLKKASDLPLFRDHMEEMKQKKTGFYTVSAGGEERLVAYDTMELTGWITALELPPLGTFEGATKLKLVYIALTVAGIVLLLGSLLFFASGLVRRIEALNDGLREIAGGNLTVPSLPAGGSDELGEMATAFNAMKESTSKLIRKIAQTAEQLSASSQELMAGSQQAADAAMNVTQTIFGVADGIAKQTNGVEEAKQHIDTAFVDINAMTAKAATVTENSEQMAGAAETGEHLMANAMSKMNGIERSVANSANVVRKLGENSQQIGMIVDSISAIADQINLLALNAAIEAARAGDAGRGFSVVAEEVRKLAEQSQTSVEEIKNHISTVRADTQKAVDAMEAGTSEVGLGTQAIREVGEQFKDITARVSSIKTDMREINGAVQKVSGGMQEVVTAMESIDEVSRTASKETQAISVTVEKQSATSEEIASASHSLASLATELQEAMGAFRVK